MHTLLKLHPLTLNCDKIVNKADIQLAITDLQLQDVPNYTATVKKYNVQRTTLMRRHKRGTISHQEAHLIY